MNTRKAKLVGVLMLVVLAGIALAVHVRSDGQRQGGEGPPIEVDVEAKLAKLRSEVEADPKNASMPATHW